MTLLALLLLGLQQQALTDAQCIACHEDQALEVKETLHQKAGVGCVSCHGTDEIVNEKHRRTASFRPAKLPQIAQLCGECHKGVFDAFKPSEHFAEALKDDGEPKHRSSCSACHEYHTTPKADSRTIMNSCLQCHERDSHEVKDADSFFQVLAQNASAVDRFRAGLNRLARKAGVSLVDLAGTADTADNDVRNAKIAQHGLDWKRLKADLAASADRTAAAYNTLAAREESFARRFLGLGLFLGLLGLSAALIAKRARALQGESAA